MSLIQLLLVSGMLGALFVYFSFFRSLLIDRVIALTLFTLALFAVIFPDYTTVAANAVGVGRGADLVLYLFATLGLFAVIVLYSRIHRLQMVQTEIIRQLALQTACAPTDGGEPR